jgi:hypothetical protein
MTGPLRILLVALMSIPATPSFADPPLKQVYRQRGYQPGGYADPYFGRQGGRVCQRWCLEDRNPCDPPEYKIQDGRCFDD